MSVAMNPHDAEEQLRPYLRDVFEAKDAFDYIDPMQTERWRECVDAEANALDAALEKALELLGVRR